MQSLRSSSKLKTQNKKTKEWIVTDGDRPKECPNCGSTNLEQDTDTFDTWFSSGQWPFATLRASQYIGDFDYFYPTTVMETGYDILPWWVCRMLMLGIHITGSVPFQTVYLHGLVRDEKGQKMSKSKGNVINPLKMVDQYGADALRMALVYGTASGNDQSLSEDKIRGMRNFANKLWNIGRFIHLAIQPSNHATIPFYDEKMHNTLRNPHDKRIISELNMLVAGVTKDMEHFRFSDA
ncbi:class I tRNA ligase family protein, partial [Candidatus Gottesmanbacteria bacterium]|nr:class I tRNA ligase family protein [Candidatus Gottesmanbacteria bacterium]